MDFNPEKYGPAVQAILGTGPTLMPLDMGSPRLDLKPLLDRFDPMRDLPNAVNEEAARACHAGLWLSANFFEESHSISQELHTPEGSAWHAILHRREPDAGNSKYWWRRVGQLPFHDALKLASQQAGYAYSTPEEFVNVCERVRGTGSKAEETALRVQLLEWQFLFDHCFSLRITSTKPIRR